MFILTFSKLRFLSGMLEKKTIKIHQGCKDLDKEQVCLTVHNHVFLIRQNKHTKV